MQSKENLIRTSSDNFLNSFLTVCEKYDVYPLPKIYTVGTSSGQSSTSRRRIDTRDDVSKLETPIQPTSTEVAPVIHVTYEYPKTSSNLQKIECRGFEISICILEALGESIRKFSTLTTIRLSNCRINAFGISQISEILSEIGCVRDLNLDMNPNIRENYYLLCSPSTKLQYLSLKYCNISDAGVERIGNELKYKEDCELPQLIGLNLANNCITDIGAGYVADMLHTNRSLQSLILTGNRIDDSGALFIIRELCMYPLTHDEIVKLRRLNYKRLLNGGSIHQKVITTERASQRSSRKSSSTQKPKLSKRSVVRKQSTSSKQSLDNVDNAPTRKSSLLESRSVHPLSVESRPVKGELIAVGNFELQHLNLSYNHLNDKSLSEFVKCLFYQSYMMLGNTSKGLLYLDLEGNDFRLEGNGTWDQIQELLRARRSSKETEESDYETVVPVESQILRRQFEV